jgi:hypothetical protein
MAVGFGNIPDEVIDYLRDVFADANDTVSTALTQRPSLHEPSLDMSFIGSSTQTRMSTPQVGKYRLANLIIAAHRWFPIFVAISMFSM